MYECVPVKIVSSKGWIFNSSSHCIYKTRSIDPRSEGGRYETLEEYSLLMKVVYIGVNRRRRNFFNVVRRLDRR